MLLDAGAEINRRGDNFAVFARSRAPAKECLAPNAILLEVEGSITKCWIVGVGDTALIAASSAGQKEIVELLIQRGADVQLSGRGGHTPLLAALEKGHAGIAQLLTRHGAEFP